MQLPYWMPAAPIAPDEPLRLRELHRYGIMDSAPEQAFDDIAAIAAAICGTPMALVTFIDGDRQWVKSRVGIDATETRREDAFCAWTILESGVMVVPDAPADKRFSTNIYVTGDPHIRFYAGAPIATRSGANLGSVCVLDTKPRQLSDEQRRGLEALARQVSRELEARQQRAFTAAFLEHTSSIIYLKDQSARYLSVNHVLQRLLPQGIDPIGRTSAEVFGDRVGAPLDDADRSVLATGVRGAVTTIDSYGDLEALTSRFSVPTLEGAYAVAAIAVDLSELRAAESRAHEADRHRRELLETIPAVIWERRYDATGALVASFVTPYIREMFGYSEDEWLSTPEFWTRSFAADDRADLEAKLLEGGAPSSHLYRVTTRDGRQLWAEVTIASFAPGDEAARGTRAVIVDATEAVDARLRREIDDRIFTEFTVLNNELATTQRTLVQQRNDLRTLNEEKNRFLGMAAHDLRSPLASILLFSDVLLRRGTLGEKDRTAVEQIKNVTRKMAAIIDDFLDISRIEAGALTLNRVVVDLNALVADMVALLRPVAERKEIRLHLAPGEPLSLAIDAAKIEQVVTNLVTNAIKFSPPRTVVILGVARREHVAEISVRDEGPGIERDDIPQLFVPFKRGAAAPTGSEASVGLGLAICSKIVDAHGGRIRVESTPGEGATFYVVLPLNPSSVTAASTDAAALRAVPSAPTSRHSSD